MSRHDQHLEAQRSFYDNRDHAHLQPSDADAYAHKLATELLARTGLAPGDRVLEVGAGFGRFTFSLLERGVSLTALDLSPRALEDLAASRDARGIEAERCRTVCGDLTDPTLLADEPPFDAVVGFFILHHLDDVPRAIEALAGRLRPGGRMAFLEPNRRNPLFLAQVMCCEDMTWREERGMFTLSGRGVTGDFERAGLAAGAIERFGFFPPQVFNRFAWARNLEARIEALGWLDPVLPFLLLKADSK